MDNEGVQQEKVSIAKRPTVGDALRQGVTLLARFGVESAHLDAALLLVQALGIKNKEELYLNRDLPLPAREEELYRKLLVRRSGGEPLSYIAGRREFWSLDFVVTPDALVPRPETELLIEVALERLGDFATGSRCRILDLGTGSGVLAVCLAKEREDLEVWAIDISSRALTVAGANAVKHRATSRIRFIQGDLFNPLVGQRESFHLIVSNPPYIRQGEIPALRPEVRDWEPRVALDGGLDGLALYRRIAREAHRFIVEGGFILLEIGADMADEVCRLFTAEGSYSPISVYRDYAGKDRVVVARKARCRDA